MCFDPVSLGIMAVGTGLSMAGGAANKASAQQAQNQSNALNAMASIAANNDLINSLHKQDAYSAQNKQDIQPAFDAFGANFEPQRQQFSAQNADRATKAIYSAPTDHPALTNTDNNQTANEIAKRLSDRLAYSATNAKNAAELNSYGGAFANADNVEQGAARNINTTNSLSRLEASMLPQRQQFDMYPYQAAQSYIKPNTNGSILQGVGNVFSTLGGSGRFSGGFGGGGMSVANTAANHPGAGLDIAGPGFGLPLYG